MSSKHNTSHNACYVEFCGNRYVLPRFSVGDKVLYCSRLWLVNGVYCHICGSVIYNLVSDDGSLPVEVHEYQLLSAGNSRSEKVESFCGFRVGDTVVDTCMLIPMVSVVEGFDIRRRVIKVRVRDREWSVCKLSYFVKPNDLIFINPVTRKKSKDRSILNEKENHA